MMEAQKITITGRNASRVTLDGAILFEGKKRYAYYFNGSDSIAQTSEVLSSDPIYATILISSVELDFVLYKSGGTDAEITNVISTPSATQLRFAFFSFSGTEIKAVYKTIIAQSRNTIKATVNGSNIEYYLNGSLVSLFSTCRFTANRFGTGGQKAFAEFMLYNLCYDGVRVNLEDVPGMKFRNVTRYELDKNDEIIPSTATLLNNWT